MYSQSAAENLFRVACRSDANVLILGPTGSGKSHLAREIHQNSSRRHKPFVVVNLATLHEGTFESELFGHERGAFTGADRKRIGKLEMAEGGTVFLDEIGDLSPRLQARLLEFLQARTICPIGGNREISLDVRIIAATHRELREQVTQGTFREDLFHRLRVIGIRLPSLIERQGEFDQILHACLEQVTQAQGRSVRRLTEGAAERLERHRWPGNLRELRNVLEYAVACCEGTEISTQNLPAWLDEAPVQSDSRTKMEIPIASDFEQTMQLFEREYLLRFLHQFGGRINRTAAQIGMSKTTLIRKIRSHGLTEFQRTPVPPPGTEITPSLSAHKRHSRGSVSPGVD